MTIATPRTVTTRRWFDAHLHLRLILMMLAIARRVGPICQAGIAMPNTAKIKTGADAARHRAEIINVFSRAGFSNFRPLMTILLTDDTDPRDVATWRDSGVVAAKYYPGGLYPDGGVKDLRYPNFKDVMAEMIAHDIPLSGHFESIGVHPLEAEQAAIDDFYFLADQGLRLGFEHVTSRAGLEAIRRYDASQVMATITPHDLYLTADDIYNPGRDKIVKPHNWHRSPSKTIEDRTALWAAAVSEVSGSCTAPTMPCTRVAPRRTVIRHPLVARATRPGLPSLSTYSQSTIASISSKTSRQKEPLSSMAWSFQTSKP